MRILLDVAASIVAFAILVGMATCAGVTVTLPRVEPELPAGRRSLLGDLAAAVRDAAWIGDGGSVSADAERRLMEADEASLGRAVINRSPTITVVTMAALGAAANDTSGLAVSQPIAPLDACLVWRRRPSARAAAENARSGSYFLMLFHSSVWSMLLLCLLCTVAFLTLLESAHPIGLPKELAQRRRQRAKPIGPFQALAFAFGALLLLGYPRGPNSTSGRVLALFWWLFSFTIAVAYLSASVLTFLTTRSEAVSSDAGLAEILSGSATGQTVLCSGRSLLCAPWARVEPLARANFTPVASDSEGLTQLMGNRAAGQPPLLLLTHQFACANLMASDANRTYSMAIVGKAAAWVSLAGPLDLVRQADQYILSLLGTGRLGRLMRQHSSDQLEAAGGQSVATEVNEWLAELRLGLPYRIGSMYGPLILLIVGVCLALSTAVCEFCYYRFFVDKEELETHEDELARKERAITLASTMDTYL